MFVNKSQKLFEVMFSAGPKPYLMDIALSAANEGAFGLFDAGYVSEPIFIRSTILKLAKLNTHKNRLGIRIMVSDPYVISRLSSVLKDLQPELFVIASPFGITNDLVESVKEYTKRVFLEVYSEKEALSAAAFNIDGLLIKGNEAGGLCGVDSNLILLQKIKRQGSIPVYVQGGIGPESALACYIGGANGIVLSDSLMLLKESNPYLSERDLRALNAKVGTVSVGLNQKEPLIRLSSAYPKIINKLEGIRTGIESRNSNKQKNIWLKESLSLIQQKQMNPGCFIGEESYWASQYAKEHKNIGGVIKFIITQIKDNLKILHQANPLRRNNPFAKDLGAEYPIFQGPMANISDNSRFMAAVAKNGAIPFAALSLTKGEQLRKLFDDIKKDLDKKPWGVGILGFAPSKLRKEQYSLIKEYSPPYVVVAGGRPSHYKTLTQMGTTPFLHVPAATMIQSFFKEGVRHFILEGKGSGGHVGPNNSFPLWQAAILEFISMANIGGLDLKDTSIIFAGGISDKLSAAMLTAFTVPLLKLGMRIGIMMGTAYLFTKEVLSTEAIVNNYQQIALECKKTVVLESGGGHAIRCAITPMTTEFTKIKNGLLIKGVELQAIQKSLDENNVGRLRIATRGCTRSEQPETDTNNLIKLPPEQQIAQGLYMMGEASTIITMPYSMAQLHNSVSDGVTQVLESLNYAPVLTSTNEDEDHTNDYERTDIAVIGMTTLIPGAQDLDTLWHNILAELCFIKDVPQERWDLETNYDPDPQAPDKIYCSKGAFLEDIFFDAMEFGIPPSSIPSIEPAQLLVLEAVKQAIADAGYKSRSFDRERTSVIFGSSGGGGDLALSYSVRAALKEYLQRASDIPSEISSRVLESFYDVLPQWTVDSFPGILSNVIAGRVCNRFDLNGLNFTVDAACASSLAAINVACQELAYGVTSMAIVGGVDTTQHPFGYTCFSKTRALSKNGDVGPFDKNSDGIILSEGVGVVVLKRIKDAINDGDRIYSVIKGVGGASDGKGHTMTVPSSRGQQMAVKRAYEIAGYLPSDIELLEAHGTGTSLGDKTELISMQTFFEKPGILPAQCAVSTIKSAIGHAKAAAGIFGLIKTCLAIYHKVFPATLKINEINNDLLPPQSPLYINTATRPWIARKQDLPRRGGVNSFGFGGTNFHVALEETHQASLIAQKVPESLWPEELFLFSATDRGKLDQSLDKLIKHAKNENNSPIANLAKQHFETYHEDSLEGSLKLALRVSDRKELQHQLEGMKNILRNGIKNRLPKGVYFQAKVPSKPSPLAGLFPGQGSQELNMSRDLAILFPIVRETFEEANQVLAHELERPLSDYIFPPPLDSNRLKADKKALCDTVIAQPALATVEMALYRLLTLFGLKLDITAGHSFGELTALWAGGVLNDNMLIRLAYFRGMIMGKSARSDETGMTAVQGDEKTVMNLIGNIDELYLANFNTPEQTVISGSRSSLSLFEKRCSENKIWFRRLQVSNAFHSPYMNQAAEEWINALERETFQKPFIPVYSNTTGGLYDSDPNKTGQILGKHLINGVRFVDEIKNIHQAGINTFLEIGPGNVLTGLVDSILKDIDHETITLQPHGISDVTSLLDALAKLWVKGHLVDLMPCFEIRKFDMLRPELLPSTTVFRVNGGRSEPTIQKQLLTTTVVKEPLARWDGVFIKSEEKTAQSTSKSQATIIEKNPEENKVIQKAQFQNTNLMQNIDSSKLKLLNQIQDNMELFLKDQARLQEERKEMMNKMWDMNKSMINAVLGGDDLNYAPAFNKQNQKDLTSRETQKDLPIPLINEASLVVDKKISPEPVKKIEHISLDHKDPGLALPKQQGKTDDLPDIQELLYKVISERTSYPVEMLEAGQHVEADLGIDSIKRVEIIGSLKDLHPLLTDITNEEYFEEVAQLKTLGEICDWIDNTFIGGRVEAITEEPVKEQTIDIQGLLYEVISERTSYPVEMLEAGQHIEADLGIDSIKRVEIIGSLKDRDPRLTDITNEEYFEEVAQLRTLGEICDWIDNTFIEKGSSYKKNEPEQQRSTDTEEQTQPQVSINEYCLQLVESPLIADRAFDLGPLLILNNGHALGSELFKSLNEKGLKTFMVCSNLDNTTPEVPGFYNADFAQGSDVLRCYEKIKEEQGKIGGILNLLALGRNGNNAGLKSVIESFRWAKAFASDLKRGNNPRPYWMSITGLGGDFGLSGKMDFEPSQNGVHGIAKTLFFECQDLMIKTVDLHPDQPLSFLRKALETELCSSFDQEREICWQKDKRYILKLRDIEKKGQQTIFRIFNSDSVFLLTGGAKGITADAAVYFAKQYSPTLILLGRSSLPERDQTEMTQFSRLADMGERNPKALKTLLFEQMKEQNLKITPVMVNKQFTQIMQERQMRSNISQMEKFGANVHYFSVDCTNREDFASLIREIYQRWGRLDGVIHGAGVIKDRLILDKDEESFKEVLDTKVKGAQILADELDFEHLSFLIFFSSVSGRFGNQGQADYAAANEILNKMAVKLSRSWAANVTAINWGPWEGEGMVSDQVREQFKKTGIHLIPRDMGVEILNREICATKEDELAEVVIFGGEGLQNLVSHDMISGSVYEEEASLYLPMMKMARPDEEPQNGHRSWILDLDLSTHKYLNDHRLDDQPVLPAAVAMELMAQAGQIIAPDMQFSGFRQFQMMQGVVLKGDRPVTLRIMAQEKRVFNGFREIEITLTIANNLSNQFNYKAIIDLGHPEDSELPGSSFHERQNPFPISVERVYNNRLFHKGVFCGITSIDGFETSLSRNLGINGVIQPSRPADLLKGIESGQWLIDPVVFDCAYQLGLLWTQEYCSMMALPSEVGSYIRYRPYNGSPVHCEVFIKNVNNPKLDLDFNFSDQDGKLFARAIDVTAIMNRALNERVLAGLARFKKEPRVEINP